jgi:hypothetical protein
VAAMVGAVVGVVRYAVLQRMWDLFTAAIINTVKFTIAAGAMTLILGAIQNAPVGMGWRLLFAIVATVIAIMITKPVASFKSMAGLDPTRSYLGAWLRRASGTAAGVVTGQKLTDRSADDGRDAPAGTPGEVTTTYRVQPVEPSMPPLPPPTTVQAVPVGPAANAGLGQAGAKPRVALQPRSVPDPERRALPGPTPVRPNAFPTERTPDEVPPDDAPRLLRPVPVVPIVAGAAVRRPVVTEHAEFPAVGGRVRPEPAATAPAGRPIRNPRPRAPLVSGAAAEPHSAPVETTRRPNPVHTEPAARPAVTSVAYPTGIVVQNEPGLYRPDRPLRIEEYLRFPEPQVDANGEETWTPLYHAKVAR